jgi:transposase
MTEHGTKLAGVPHERLRSLFRDVEDATALRRLVAAIEYKRGSAPADVAAAYGVPRSTVYDWLDRVAEDGVPAGLYDEDRPGRPAALTDAERAALQSVLWRPPTAAGLAATEWTPQLVKRYVADRFGTSYSERHARRLLERAREGALREGESSR